MGYSPLIELWITSPPDLTSFYRSRLNAQTHDAKLVASLYAIKWQRISTPGATLLFNFDIVVHNFKDGRSQRSLISYR